MFSKLVVFFLTPLGTSLCLLGLALWLGWRHRWRHSIWLATVAFAWLWVWSLPAASSCLRGTIEYQYPPLALNAYPAASAIVVLGGALAPPAGRSSESNLGAAADRVRYAAHLFHAGKAPLILLSGGADPQQYRYSEARAMAAFLEELGVAASALLLEEDSRNTRENASYSASLLKAQGVGHILLVTSALHMPRARKLFSDQGFQVVPAPTDFESDQGPSGLLAWLPDGGALDGSGRAFKELIGLWAGR